MPETPLPDPAPILELMNAFRTSGVLFAAVSLGVFDRLSGGPATLDQLARDLGAHRDALERLLGTCVGLGLLTRQEDTLATTPVAQVYLAKDSPRRMTGYIAFSGRVLWHLWANLADAIREGTHRWKQTYDLDGPIFSSFFRTEEDTREFLLGMHGYGLISSPEVVAAFDLGRYRHLVDLGGATGHLAVAACRRYPELKGTVFDLSPVVQFANEILGSATDLQGRVQTQVGDFFVDELPEADLFAVGRILHDWEESKIRKLLARIHAALPPGGSLLIAEKLLADDRAGPRWAHLQSLNMLVCTEGKERTLGEYTAFLREAGFDHIEGRTTKAPLDAVLATRSK